MAGLEVDGEAAAKPFINVVVGEVLSVLSIRMRMLNVKSPTINPSVVCGAPNVRAV